MKLMSSMLLCVGLGLLAACGTAEDGTWEEQATEYRTAQSALLIPGEREQGTDLHGSGLSSMGFSSASLGSQPLQNLRLEKGGLVAERNQLITGTTASLEACTTSSSGVTRSCGFTSMGVGSCTPGASVTLGGGACGTGSCTGNPVMRVCSGTLPCEHSRTTLASSDNACFSLCPQVTFTCPASGTYNVMGAPSTSGQYWSMSLQESSGTFPATETLSGAQLKGANLVGLFEGNAVIVTLAEVRNAKTEPVADYTEWWDASGDTWLYHLKRRSVQGGEDMVDVCGLDGSKPFAVAVGGLYDPVNGNRSESVTNFTFSCDSGVIAKCYRWGYQPWKDGAAETRMKYGHASCTRMARADYCGDGTSHTLEGTRILPWDELPPAVLAYPATVAKDMEFEGSWTPSGVKCLNHWRWADMPASCGGKLTPPIYSSEGKVLNRCLPGQKQLPNGEPCASICDTAEEAKAVFYTKVFNSSVPGIVSP